MSPWQLVPERPIEPLAPVYCRRSGRMVNLIGIDTAWLNLMRAEMPVRLPAQRPAPAAFQIADAPAVVERFDFLLYPLRVPNDGAERDAYIFMTDEPEAAATITRATLAKRP